MLTILDLLATSGVSYRRVGGSSKRGAVYHSPCPRCGGVDRFTSYPDQGEGGTWHCRGCDHGGDLIEYMKHVEGLSYPDALKKLGLEREREARRLPGPAAPQAKEEKFSGTPRDLPPPLWREKAHKLWHTAMADLLWRAEAQQWLLKRGVSQAGIVQGNLGWLCGEKDQKCYYRSRTGWGLPKEEKQLRDGRTVEKKLWIPRGLLLPTFLNGEVVAMRVRLPEADRRSMSFATPYYVVPGSAALPMVLVDERVTAAHGAVRNWVILESQLDAVAVAEVCGGGPDSIPREKILPVGAAAMLSNTGKPDPALHQKLAAADRILVALDYDQPGARGWNWWKDTYPKAERWPVPEGKDPGEYVKLGGSLYEWIEKGLEPKGNE